MMESYSPLLGSETSATPLFPSDGEFANDLNMPIELALR
jgi:hypothetical protein